MADSKNIAPKNKKAVKTSKEVEQYKITDPALIKLKGLYIMDRGERL